MDNIIKHWNTFYLQTVIETSREERALPPLPLEQNTFLIKILYIVCYWGKVQREKEKKCLTWM